MKHLFVIISFFCLSNIIGQATQQPIDIDPMVMCHTDLDGTQTTYIKRIGYRIGSNKVDSLITTTLDGTPYTVPSTGQSEYGQCANRGICFEIYRLDGSSTGLSALPNIIGDSLSITDNFKSVSWAFIGGTNGVVKVNEFDYDTDIGSWGFSATFPQNYNTDVSFKATGDRIIEVLLVKKTCN